jgi:1,6-anhydro-N-acetylmuramate kinase
MAQTLRQQARRKVNEATATRKRAWAEREAKLADATVEVVAAIVARDRAEEAAAEAIGAMTSERLSLTEIGDRCGLPLKEVVRLRRTYPGDSRQPSSMAAGSGAPEPRQP